jgi:hypothetical protein
VVPLGLFVVTALVRTDVAKEPMPPILRAALLVGDRELKRAAVRKLFGPREFAESMLRREALRQTFNRIDPKQTFSAPGSAQLGICGCAR